MNELQGKTALVTGASSGIGLAITQCLLDHGCHVIGLARDFQKASINSPLFEAHSQDLADLNGTSSLLKKLLKKHQPDFFIHSAGAGQFGSIEQFSVRQIESYIQSNLSSALVLSRHIVPVMRNNKSGRIIFIGSESSTRAGKKGALYSSVKFGLRGLAFALREDCSKDGIAVSLINPGMVRTPFFDQLNFRPAEDSSNAICAEDVAQTVLHILQSNPDIVFDEINLSPRNRSIDFR
jgi:NADP-dependent 3-hydroxy acid dehydrogenase YdfG